MSAFLERLRAQEPHRFSGSELASAREILRQFATRPISSDEIGKGFGERLGAFAWGLQVVTHTIGTRVGDSRMPERHKLEDGSVTIMSMRYPIGMTNGGKPNNGCFNELEVATVDPDLYMQLVLRATAAQEVRVVAGSIGHRGAEYAACGTAVEPLRLAQATYSVAGLLSDVALGTTHSILS